MCVSVCVCVIRMSLEQCNVNENPKVWIQNTAQWSGIGEITISTINAVLMILLNVYQVTKFRLLSCFFLHNDGTKDCQDMDHSVIWFVLG